MANPGPGKGCFKFIFLTSPKDFPNVLTSSLKKFLKGSIILNSFF